MNIYTQKQRWKFVLFLVAVLIGIGSLLYTNILVDQLSREEKKKVELWAQATKRIAESTTDASELGFLIEVLENNETVPVILVDHTGQIASWLNIDTIGKNKEFLQRQLEEMKLQHDPILIDIGGGEKNLIYYKNSLLLKQLTYYPLVQLGVIVLFILVSYFAFSISRRAEQNKVWVGLSKETAHQLGTPTSSLIAWVEILKSKNIEPSIAEELEKDVKRLEKISDRFSKIGSKPKLKSIDLNEILSRTQEYLKTRISEHIEIVYRKPDTEMPVMASASLLEWVIENISKNAIDAIEGKGRIEYYVHVEKGYYYIDIKDNGKGIIRSRHKTIFKPGYTTKERGWGLGLSLSKRIIEEYHQGKIFVFSSEPGKGTIIRIILKREG